MSLIDRVDDDDDIEIAMKSIIINAISTQPINIIIVTITTTTIKYRLFDSSARIKHEPYKTMKICAKSNKTKFLFE